MLVTVNDTSITDFYKDIMNAELFYDKENDVYILQCTAYESEVYEKCPYCGGEVYIQDHYTITLKDAPIIPDTRMVFRQSIRRYQCRSCDSTFSQESTVKYPGTRITKRAALQIRLLLMLNTPISAISRITGVNWGTIARIHKEEMQESLSRRAEILRSTGYKPKQLAVDEFAIHKGQTYATCVMDLDTGEILWVGKGRTLADFIHFFEDVDMDLLSEVRAVAMDMNAAYNQLVTEYLPKAQIVYDRYHMQAQYGRDVLGSVRLEEAKEHQIKARDMKAGLTEDLTEDEKKKLKALIKEENGKYTTLKKSRWSLLRNSSNLTEPVSESLQKILAEHDKVSVCYAMKEELCDLFDITDRDEAETRWREWFRAAKESGIQQLVKFAELKEKRIDGLVSHAEHRISTGKLEGFNNRIKVAKRIGYGYRNDEYFFTMIRYLSLPSVRGGFHKFS